MQTKRNRAGYALVAITALGLGWFVLRGGEAPTGQPPLITLDVAALEGLRTDFNRDGLEWRLILLLSPT
jgi:hypothetical protein